MYLEAGLAGWRVFRLGPDQLTMGNVARLADLVRRHTPGDSEDSI